MSRKKISGIYALKCPDTGDVKYVGQSVNIKSRYSQHRNPKNFVPVSLWVRSIAKESKIPLLEILEETQDLDEREVFWINHFGMDSLFNMHGGGKNTIFASGNGRTSCITNIPGMRSPFTVVVQCLWRFSTNKKIMAELARWRDVRRSIETEEEMINFQTRCFVFAHSIASIKQKVRLEEWAIAVAPKINERYPRRLTLVYNDGVEVTP